MQPDHPLRYFIDWRCPPGPWQRRNLPGGIMDLSQAVRSAQAIMQEQPGRQARVLDQHGRLHWVSEPSDPATQESPLTSIKTRIQELRKLHILETGAHPSRIYLSPRIYYLLNQENVTDRAEPPPQTLYGAQILLRQDATLPEIEVG